MRLAILAWRVTITITMLKLIICCHLANIFFFFLMLSYYNLEKPYRFLTFNTIKQDLNFCGLSSYGYASQSWKIEEEVSGKQNIIRVDP